MFGTLTITPAGRGACHVRLGRLDVMTCTRAEVDEALATIEGFVDGRDWVHVRGFVMHRSELREARAACIEGGTE